MRNLFVVPRFTKTVYRTFELCGQEGCRARDWSVNTSVRVNILRNIDSPSSRKQAATRSEGQATPGLPPERRAHTTGPPQRDAPPQVEQALTLMFIIIFRNFFRLVWHPWRIKHYQGNESKFATRCCPYNVYSHDRFVVFQYLLEFDSFSHQKAWVTAAGLPPSLLVTICEHLSFFVEVCRGSSKLFLTQSLT